MLFSCGGSVKPNVFAVAVTVYSVVIDKIPFALLPVYGNPRAVGYLAEYNGAYIRSFADIQPPDFETRMAIIKNKSVSLGFDLPDDVCTFIAENVTSNVRLLEGTVKKIRAYHDLDNMELTVPNVSRAIKDMYNREKAENLPTPNLIIGEVSRFYNIEESVIRGTLKNKNTAEARQVAMYLVRKLTNLSLPDIGKEFGRDHSTVIHSLKKVEQQLASGSGALSDNIRDITANINSKL